MKEVTLRADAAAKQVEGVEQKHQRQLLRVSALQYASLNKASESKCSFGQWILRNASNRGHVDSVETLAINDPTARASGLQSGSLHLINCADPKIVSVLEKNANIQILEISGAGHYCFPMRCDTTPFDNNDLRLALKYAIDREEIVKKVLRGHGKVGNDQPIPSFDPFYAADIPQRPYDPEKAKFHFKKSGYSGRSCSQDWITFPANLNANQQEGTRP